MRAHHESCIQGKCVISLREDFHAVPKGPTVTWHSTGGDASYAHPRGRRFSVFGKWRSPVALPPVQWRERDAAGSSRCGGRGTFGYVEFLFERTCNVTLFTLIALLQDSLNGWVKGHWRGGRRRAHEKSHIFGGHKKLYTSERL